MRLSLLPHRNLTQAIKICVNPFLDFLHSCACDKQVTGRKRAIIIIIIMDASITSLACHFVSFWEILDSSWWGARLLSHHLCRAKSFASLIADNCVAAELAGVHKNTSPLETMLLHRSYRVAWYLVFNNFGDKGCSSVASWGVNFHFSCLHLLDPSRCVQRISECVQRSFSKRSPITSWDESLSCSIGLA